MRRRRDRAGPSGAVVAHDACYARVRRALSRAGRLGEPQRLPAATLSRSCYPTAVAPRPKRPGDCEPEDPSTSRIGYVAVMFNAVGGSSIYYGALWHRLLPSDFRVRSVDGVCNVGRSPTRTSSRITTRSTAPSASPASMAIRPSAGLTYAMPPHPLGKAGRRERGRECTRVALVAWLERDRRPRQQDARALCALGNVQIGCPEAKASFDLIYMPQALKAGAALRPRARVRKILTSGGIAHGVIWIDRDGVEHVQPANAVWCAPTASARRGSCCSPMHPTTLTVCANSSGLVRHNLMLHPNCVAFGFYDGPRHLPRPARELICRGVL